MITQAICICPCYVISIYNDTAMNAFRDFGTKLTGEEVGTCIRRCKYASLGVISVTIVVKRCSKYKSLTVFWIKIGKWPGFEKDILFYVRVCKQDRHTMLFQRKCFLRHRCNRSYVQNSDNSTTVFNIPEVVYSAVELSVRSSVVV